MIPRLTIRTESLDFKYLIAPGTHTQVWRDNDGNPAAYGSVIDGTYCLRFPSLATYTFRRASENVNVIPEAGVSVHLIRDNYFRNVLPMLLQLEGFEVLHASAVKLRTGIVAFCARSESGKSTISYGLSQRGYPLWADDAVALDFSAPVVQAVPLPFSPRLRRASAEHFGVELPDNNTILNEHDQITNEQDMQAVSMICVIERLPLTEQEARIQAWRLHPAHAFQYVLPHAYCFSLEDVERKQAMIRNYIHVCLHTPIYAVRYPTGLEYLSQILNTIEICFDEIGLKA